MRNKHPGTCYRCGGMVEPDAGHFEFVGHLQKKKWPQLRYAGLKWMVQHFSCAIKHRGTNVHYLYQPEKTDAGAES